MEVGTIAPHWMDTIIAACRSKSMLGNRAVSCIRNSIASHKKGARVGNHPDIRNAIEAGLQAAKARELVLKRDPTLAGASPDEAARRVILERIGE